MKKTIAYWITTGLFCLGQISGGIAVLIGAPPPQVTEAFDHLGYPQYLLIFLGVAEILGAAALLAPRWPKLKEWAYAGFTFNFLGAAYSHWANGDAFMDILPPLLFLGLMTASYCLRPTSRRESK